MKPYNWALYIILALLAAGVFTVEACSKPKPMKPAEQPLPEVVTKR